jgi:hypothetical protein
MKNINENNKSQNHLFKKQNELSTLVFRRTSIK